MRNTLTIDSVDLLSRYNVEVSGYETFAAPQKSYKFYTIPKRNGLRVSSNGRYDNITVQYKAGIATNFATNIEGLRAFLLSREGYVRIEDSYHTNEFRKGVYEGPFAPSVSEQYDAGEFTLEFNCMPQRYLKSGETATTYNYSAQSTTITNPTMFDAKPLLRVYGYGDFTLGDNVRVSITQHARAYCDIDCETLEAYYSTYSMASYVTMKSVTSPYPQTADYPVIPAGGGSLNFYDNTITKIEITPRWFTL